MNRFIITKLSLALLLVAMSCEKEESETPAQGTLPEPKVLVGDVTSTSFSVSWDVVTDAGSYTYIFNEKDTVTTKDRMVSYSDLTPSTEYSFAVKTDAGINGSYADSRYVTVHVITEGESVLEAPEPVLVAAYKSRTIINWKPVSGASAYEYSVAGMTGKVETCSVELSGFSGSTDYVFRLKALSDEQYVNDSPEAELKFTTRPESEDIPQIIMSLLECGSDYANFNVYAVPDFRYVYFGVPACYFKDHSDTEIRDTYLKYILDAIEDSNMTVEGGMSSYSNTGSSNYTEYPLYPELSYYIVAFGVSLDGKATTPLYKITAKTKAHDTMTEPSLDGADWFSQAMFHSVFGQYNSTNCIWTNWTGNGVAKMNYVLTSTYSFNSYFDGSFDLFRRYTALKGSEVTQKEYIEKINGEGGMTTRFAPLSAATSYTLGTLAVNEAGDTTFVVNTLSTMTSDAYYNWASVTLGTSASYPASSALAATVTIAFDPTESLNIQVSGGRYLLCRKSELAGVDEAAALKIVKEKGIDFKPTQIKVLNMTGNISMSFGVDDSPLEPGTEYTLLVSLVSASGDEVLRHSTASTAEGTKTRSAVYGEPKGRIEINAPVILDTYEISR